MIVCTRAADALTRQAFGKDNASVSKLETMMESFTLNPSVSTPKKEAFIVTSEDVRSPKIKQRFLIAASMKHPAVRIVFIDRNGKTDIVKGKGIDEVLLKPKAADLSKCVHYLVEHIEDKAPVASSADTVTQIIEKFKPKENKETAREPLEQRLNRLEQAIIADILIKKSLRVFVSLEGCGRTVVPLVLSQLKSKQNANVLLVDLTGTSKLADYGCSAYELEHWIQERYEEEFCIVVGSIGNSVEMAGRVLAALAKAAGHYRVINVVMSPEQIEAFHVIAKDALCVNYITDTNNATFEFMRKFMKQTRHDYVARRAIINKCTVSVPYQAIIEKLDLLDNMDVNVAKIDYIPQIIECSFNKVKPYDLNFVGEGFVRLSKYV